MNNPLNFSRLPWFYSDTYGDYKTPISRQDCGKDRDVVYSYTGSNGGQVFTGKRNAHMFSIGFAL